MTISVKWATTLSIGGSTMSGLPRISGTAGDLKAALNAFLCTGFNLLTLDSLSRTGTTATAVRSAGLGFIPDQVIAIAGANQTEWNTEYRVVTASSTQVTFTVPDTHAASPTGTITIKSAPAGFTMTDLGGSLAVFRPDDVTGNRLNLWVDDSATTYARVRGWETWSGGSGTGPFPTDTQISGGLYSYRSNAAGTASRNYIFSTDGNFFYLFTEWNPASYAGNYEPLIFGDIISWMGSDAFGTIIVANAAASQNQPNANNDFGVYSPQNPTSRYIARDTTLNPNTVSSFRSYGPSESPNYLGGGSYTYPNPLDGGDLAYEPIRISHSSAIPRGQYPGMMVPLHNTPYANGAILGNFPTKADRKFIAAKSANYEVLIDIIGPWR